MAEQILAMLTSDHCPAFSYPVPPDAFTHLRLLVGLAVETEPGSIGKVVFGYELSPRTTPTRTGAGGVGIRSERATIRIVKKNVGRWAGDLKATLLLSASCGLGQKSSISGSFQWGTIRK
jgi:hypothetical protein